MGAAGSLTGAEAQHPSHALLDQHNFTQVRLMFCLCTLADLRPATVLSRCMTAQGALQHV